MNTNVIYQDNQRSIKLKKNGKRSKGKRTRHLDICFFFVTDRIKEGDISVKYCPTDMVVFDFLTKPLQGRFFSLFLYLILNLDHNPSSLYREAETNSRQASTKNNEVSTSNH